ncbi:MAG TPA: ProQ/FinO family protein [Marinospirillum sp.]|uniref:ProQ/FinO family protein n=1 Tax=Marinospirillum sp. TaxID=2183934 RepID=UPI002B49A51E|nr:ProQ/FinO family protein [Marinospirillum sp.]HKM16507.1 ProQ/FinO family protein [Marinospirillum sp.]
MSLESILDVNNLLEQLESYADKGLGALGTAQQDIQQLTKRVAQLETKLEKLTQQLDLPTVPAVPTAPAAVVAAVEATSALDKLNSQQRLKHWIKIYSSAFILSQPKPLKVGIHDDLLAAEGGELKKIQRALAGYVKLPRYLHCLKAGAVRLDLQGQPAGSVTQQEADFAQAQLQKLAQNNKQREAQKKQQQAKQEERLITDRLQNKLSALMQLNTR